MSLDYQQVRQQIQALGEQAPQRARRLAGLRQRAAELLVRHAQDQDALRERVQTITRLHDPNLRCALPALRSPEPLNACTSLPRPPAQATLLAADGSQITPDRHAEVNFGLINVGVVQLRLGLPDPPAIHIQSQLIYDDELYTPGGTITEEKLSLMRDLAERSQLADLATVAPPPVITFTDGPMELWGAKDSADSADFERSLAVYHAALARLREQGAATAGYVDKPFANLVVRLLEVASIPESQLPEVKNNHPLQGVLDQELFRDLLAPGDRSAVFALQSRSAQRYRDDLALHFFYLNVGREGHPWLARVEIPAWVAQAPQMLSELHAVLVQQCRILGSRPYPYLLHRAHEAAVVTLAEKDQVTQMIALELRRRGVNLGEISHKQSAKIAGGKTRYTSGGKPR
jgi:hypothetical protein